MSDFSLTDICDKVPIEEKNYFSIHKNRFEQSLEFLAPYVSETSCLLEIGSPTFFTDILKFKLKFQKLDNTWQDLRKPINYGDGVFDVVVCMEVIEHIKDEEDVGGYNETFYGNGQQNLLKECNRVLKPDGILFLTSPNLNSARSLRQLLTFCHPFTYWPHVREMSINDLKKFLGEAKFKIELLKTKESWYNMTDEDRRILFELSKFGFSPEFREDNIFIVAKKL